MLQIGVLVLRLCPGLHFHFAILGPIRSRFLADWGAVAKLVPQSAFFIFYIYTVKTPVRPQTFLIFAVVKPSHAV